MNETTPTPVTEFGIIAPEVIAKSFRWFSRDVVSSQPEQIGRLKRKSFLLGIAGVLCFSIFAVANLVFVATKFDEWFPSDPDTEVMAFLVGSIYAPLASAFTLTTFVPLLGTQRLSLRFVFAFLAAFFTFAVLGVASVSIERMETEWNDLKEIGVVLLSFVLGVGLVAVILQNGSSRSLVPCRTNLDRATRMSILDLLELMGLTACIFAFWKFTGPGWEMTSTLIISGLIGVGCGILLVPLLLGFFATRRRWIGLGTGFAIAFSVASACIALLISDELGAVVSTYQISIIVSVGLLTAFIYSVYTLLVFWWLKGCGWSMTSG